MKTALIVDPDIGFGFWLGRGLDQSHYESFPAKSVVDATALLDELRLQVDLLILNPALPDTAKLIESLRRSNDELRVVALIGDQPRLPEIAARVDLCCRKPDRSEVKRLEWIGHVEELLPASLFGATFKNSALLRKCAGTLVRYARHRDGGLDDSRRLDSAVAPSWPDWEGHIVQNEYRLERYLGSSEQSAVFLTRCGDGVQQAAAIKVVLATPRTAKSCYRDGSAPRHCRIPASSACSTWGTVSHAAPRCCTWLWSTPKIVWLNFFGKGRSHQTKRAKCSSWF